MSEPKDPTRSERIRALDQWIGESCAGSLMEALALLCEQLEGMVAETREHRRRTEAGIARIEERVGGIRVGR